MKKILSAVLSVMCLSCLCACTTASPPFSGFGRSSYQAMPYGYNYSYSQSNRGLFGSNSYNYYYQGAYPNFYTTPSYYQYRGPISPYDYGTYNYYGNAFLIPSNQDYYYRNQNSFGYFRR